MKKIFLSILVLISIVAQSQQKDHYGNYGWADTMRWWGALYHLGISPSSSSSGDSAWVKDATTGQFKLRAQSAIGISGITADNGLTASTSTNVQWFGTVGTPATLLNDRYLTASDKTINITGASAATYTMNITSTNTAQVLQVVADGSNSAIYATGVTGSAIVGTVSSSGKGVSGISSSGYGIYGESASSYGGTFASNSSSTNTVEPVLQVERFASATPANGIGGSIDFNTRTIDFGGQISNQLISKWTDATNATRTSQFIITGVDAGTTRTLMSADGNGAIVMYGAGNPGQTLEAVNTSNNAIYGHTSSGIGVTGASISGYGVQAATNASSTNTILGTFNIVRGSTGTAANGIGASADYILQADNGSQYLSNQNISKWTTAANATRTSEFSITGVTSASTETWLTIGQSGYLKVRPMTVTEAGALTPAEGMIVFVSNTNGTWTSIGLWCYQNGAWHAL